MDCKTGAIPFFIWTSGTYTTYTLRVMAQSKEQIELAALNTPPGILPPYIEFDNYTGHNVINISKVDLKEH